MERSIKDFYEKIEKKLSVTSEQIGSKFPYTTHDGKYEDFAKYNSLTWWTNGFWGGIMWKMYIASKDEKYKTIAEGCEKLLDKAFEDFVGLHHDVGFMWLPTAVADYKITGNEQSRARGLHAATILAGRYNPNGRFIRAWNNDATGWAIIDCMMNLNLLYWASDELKDPRFRQIAENHADTVIKNFMREDGSFDHIVIFDDETGEKLDNPAGQGYASGSAWSRGQAWALYGFTLSYMHTKNQKYLDVAKKAADYFIGNLTDCFIPVVDFKAPKEPVKYDTTAAGIACCGLIELAKITSDDRYMTCAVNIVNALEDNCNFSLDEQSILQNGSERYHEESTTHIPIIYGDFFMLEAVLKLMNKDVLFW